jgi:hypothetical protein
MTENPRRFYVYLWLRNKNSEHGPRLSPFYVGKGTGNRCYVDGGRPVFAPKDRSYIVTVQERLTEEEAFRLEQYCIKLYGRIDLGTGILHNRSDGGEGPSGMVVTEKFRQMRSAAWGGENNPKFGGDTLRGELNPMWGKQHSEETRQKIKAKNAAHYGTTEGKLANKLRAQKYLYELIDPAGEVYVTDNLWEFSQQYGLANASLNKVVHGKARHHKGWTGRIIEHLR